MEESREALGLGTTVMGREVTPAEIAVSPSLLKPGGGISYHQFEEPSSNILQTFPAPTAIPPITDRGHTITFSCDQEITALCPLTGQPDFYSVVITYQPHELCIESKSAKLYFGSYRNVKGFIEELALRMLTDWVKVCSPKFIRITLTMAPRGGIAIEVIREYGREL